MVTEQWVARWYMETDPWYMDGVWDMATLIPCLAFTALGCVTSVSLCRQCSG